MIEERIKDKEKEKPKLIEKLSKKGAFQEKTIFEIIEEKNPESNQVELPNEITKEMPNCIELPPIQLNNGEIYCGGWNLQGEKEGYGISIDNGRYNGMESMFEDSICMECNDILNSMDHIHRMDNIHMVNNCIYSIWINSIYYYKCNYNNYIMDILLHSLNDILCI